MVNVWFCSDGENPTDGEKSDYTKELDFCIDVLELSEAQFFCDLSITPKFGDPNDKMAQVRGRRHVVLEIGEEEVNGTGWKPGFYLLYLSPEEVFKRLGPREN